MDPLDAVAGAATGAVQGAISGSGLSGGRSYQAGCPALEVDGQRVSLDPEALEQALRDGVPVGDALAASVAPGHASGG